MEIHYETSYGIKPELLDRLSGLNPDPMVSSVRLCLIESGSEESVSNDDRARVFGSVFSRLARGRSIILLFPYDVNDIRRKLEALNIEWKKENGGLLVEVSSSETQVLFEVLRATAFTVRTVTFQTLTGTSSKLVPGAISEGQVLTR